MYVYVCVSMYVCVYMYVRQGCCIAPVLFHLFTCLVWQARVEGDEGVGITLNSKYDQKLFRRYTRNANVELLMECLFPDDGALLASTRRGAERAVGEYQATCSGFGLTVSNPKTKHMLIGRRVTRNPLVWRVERYTMWRSFPI